jgi:hypothetical protein
MKSVEIPLTIGNIFRSFCIIYSRLVQFVVVWYIFTVLVFLDQDKSGNPGLNEKKSVFIDLQLITQRIVRK